MLVMPITFDDLEGNEVTKEFHFHLSPSAVVELEVSYEDGLEAAASRLVAKKDAAALIELFKDLVRRSYGVKDVDGITFVQSPELSTRFTQTDAYSKLFLQLMGDAQEAVRFMRGIMPKKIQDQLPETVDLEKFQQQLPASQPVLDGGSPADETIFLTPSGEPEGQRIVIGETPQAEPSVPVDKIPAPSEQPAWITEGRVPTMDELDGATKEQVQLAFARRSAKG